MSKENNPKLIISFEGIEPAQFDRYADELVNRSKDIDPVIEVEWEAAKADSQEVGSILNIIFSVPAKFAIARGIGPG